MSDALLSALTENHSYSPWWPHAPFWFCMAEDPEPPSMADIKVVVIKHFKVERSSFNSARRGRACFARQVAMYLTYRLTEHSHSVIGRHFKKCDHTASLHASKVISARVERDEQFAVEVAKLEAVFA